MTQRYTARDYAPTLAVALPTIIVVVGFAELAARPFLTRWAWTIVIAVALALAVPALIAVHRAPHLSTRSWWIWCAMVIAVPVAGPLAWYVLGSNPTRPDWILLPVIATATILIGFAVALSVRDYGLPTEPPYQIHVGGRNYLHPHAQPDALPAEGPYRDLGPVTPVPPFGRYPVLTRQQSGTPTTVYMRWWDGTFYSYGLSGGP